MDCKFISQNDFLERYLLDRLTESEKAEYLSHLTACESCKSKLESEKELIGSVRHFGKKEMKSEIAKQVTAIKSKKKDVDWDMILKVAAIFFFLVITPGLVYYYQSVEPPQISELYDFDEVGNQQKGIEIVEAKEEIETRSAAIEKRKKESEEKSSDLIKSASGAGAQPPVQSIEMAKPAKKSVPRVETPSEAEVEDVLVFKDKLPLPAAPKSSTQSARMAKSSMASEKTVEEELLDDVSGKTDQKDTESLRTSIPELEKFVNPNFFKAVDQEHNRRSDLKSGTTFFNDSPKTHQGLLKTNQVYNLLYKINDKNMAVNLIPLYNETDFYSKESYPDSFPVIKTISNNSDIKLDWFINKGIRNIDPAEISIYYEENKYLYINILNEVFYRIDLSSDSTKAVIMQ